MTEEYATALKQFSTTNHDVYQQVLTDCQQDIIVTFGGLDTMIHLCLTNHQFSTNKYKSHFDSFKNLMESQKVNINKNNENDINSDIVIKYDDGSFDIDQNTDNNNKNNANVILPNLPEFYKYSLGMIAHYSNSIYFMLLPTRVANYIFEHILHTKIYPVCSIIMFAVLAIATQIYSYFVSEYDLISYFLVSATGCIVVLLSLSYILSANISIVSFILQTFDFWYKMYNLILWITSAYFVFATNITVYVIVSVAAVCGYILSFVVDATSVRNKSKNVCIITVALWSIFVAIRVYFFIDDTNNYWNPFEQYNFQYSRINFKSVFVSSQINLCLFMLKPIFSQINRKIRRCIHNKKNINIRQNIQDDSESFVQRSYVLYKRPYIHWVHD